MRSLGRTRGGVPHRPESRGCLGIHYLNFSFTWSFTAVLFGLLPLFLWLPSFLLVPVRAKSGLERAVNFFFAVTCGQSSIDGVSK